MIANTAVHQCRVKSQRLKHRPSQHEAVREPMEWACPNLTTETISVLINHNNPWHVNHLETTIQFQLEQTNLFNQSMKAGQRR
jgi:hypothetical protein